MHELLFRQYRQNYTTTPDKRQIVVFELPKFNKPLEKIDDTLELWLYTINNKIMLPPTLPKIAGIINITPDSFSDGGSYLKPDDALAHAYKLINEGIGILDLGAASSNPSAKPVAPATEIERLAPVLEKLKQKPRTYELSIDSYHSEVQRYALQNNVDYLNDTGGFANREFHSELAESQSKLVIMHSIQRKGHADHRDSYSKKLYQEIIGFFEKRLDKLFQKGVECKRCILDPGMGFFLGANAASSLSILARLEEIKAYFQMPLYISVSRKSFLGSINERSIEQRGALSLAAELFAWQQGCDYIRTHDAIALHDACQLWDKLKYFL